MHALHHSLWALCLLGFYTTPAIADSFGRGIYSGVQLGHGNYQGTSNYEDNRRFMGGLSLGYRFTPYFATELNYQHLGQSGKLSNAESIWLNIDQAAILGKFSYPITPKLEPYLKLGVSRWFGEENNRSTDGMSPVISGGLQYSLSPKVQLGLTYQYIESIGNSIDIGHSGVFFETNFKLGRDGTPDIENDALLYNAETEIEKQPRANNMIETTFSTTFGFNSIEITDVNALSKLVAVMKANDSLSAHIYGYASPIGKRSYNTTLSKKRADIVMAFLVTQGIATERLVSIGRGEYTLPVSPISLGQRVDVLINVE